MRVMVLLMLFLTVTLTAGKRTDKFLLKVDKTQKTLLYDQLKAISSQGGDYLGYAKFTMNYLKKWHEIRKNDYNYSNRRWSRRSISAIDLFSGGIAIRESLQLDTISNSNITNNKNLKEDMVLLSTLKGPIIKSHPFKQMLGDKKYSLSPISKFAPNDFYYIHINSFTKALNLWDDLMLKLKPLYKRFETANVDYKIKDKIMLQIALKENKALRIFYDLVVEEAAIIGSDPFIVTGTDITLVFKVKNSMMFDAKIKDYRGQIKKEEKAKFQNLKINGYKVNFLSTKDRRVNSYYVKIDDKHFILSNSKEALKTVINTYKNPIVSLFNAEEYKYMRSIYKLDKDEGIFLYLSDPFIRRLTGPEIRLKESQRITTQFRLTKMQNLLLLYHNLYKKAPKSIKEMILKLAPKDEKKSKEHYDYFINFAKDLKLSKNKQSIKSVVFGNLGYFRPNIDNTRFKYVTKTEAQRYKNFLRNYNNYWRDYFDPIGIKLSTKNEKIVIDTHILPLINSSMYDQVKKAIGGQGVQLNYTKLPSEWLKVSFKVTDFVKKMLPRFYKELSREFKLVNSEYIDFSKIIGENITFSVLDSSPLVDFNMNGLFTDMLTRRSRGYGVIALMLSSFAHPLRASLPLKADVKILETEVNSVINHLTNNPNTRDLSWTFYKKSYKNQDYTVLTLKFWDMVTFRIYFMFTNNSLEVTTTEKYLENIIDFEEINKRKHIPQNRVRKSRNISMAFHPNSIKLEKEYFSNMLIDNLLKNNLKNIRTLSLLKSIYGKELSPKEFYERFGFDINSPLNENYIYNKDNTITHPTLSGYKLEKLNMENIQKEILNKYYSIKNAKIEFEFTTTGIDTRVIVE